LEEETVKRLREIVGEDWVITNTEAIEDYLADETSPIIRPKPAPDVVVVKPATTEEVSKILKLANEKRIPVYPRGGGTGLVGGCVPTQSGIILSMERMKKVEIDEENLMAVCEAGVTLRELLDAVERAGLFFPPHPGDETAQVGGLVACNAGGVRAVKYGVFRNYVKGLEVVLPTGEVLNLGGKLIKNVAGYDLLQLMIGSEGTLGVITKAVLRLYPKPKASATLVVAYDDRHEAIRTVPHILQEGIIPLAIEYVERDLMEKSAEKLGLRWPVEKGEVYLLIIVTGGSREEVYSMAERIDEVCQKHHPLDVLIVESRRKQEDILRIRGNIYLTLKPDTVDILDVAVPPANIAKLMDAIDEIAKKYNAYIPMYGHAGDGNLHPHIMRKEAGGVDEKDVERVRDEIYSAAIKLGGTITAEHGIGKLRRRSLGKFLSEKEREIMRKIKAIFDPNNILNPEAAVPA